MYIIKYTSHHITRQVERDWRTMSQHSSSKYGVILRFKISITTMGPKQSTEKVFAGNIKMPFMINKTVNNKEPA